MRSFERRLYCKGTASLNEDSSRDGPPVESIVGSLQPLIFDHQAFRATANIGVPPETCVKSCVCKSCVWESGRWEYRVSWIAPHVPVGSCVVTAPPSPPVFFEFFGTQRPTRRNSAGIDAHVLSPDKPWPALAVALGPTRLWRAAHIPFNTPLQFCRRCLIEKAAHPQQAVRQNNQRSARIARCVQRPSPSTLDR